ncbi:CapA family protein, partial [Streptomyces sp. NPDC058398]
MITRARKINLALAAALIAAAVTSQAHDTAARHPGGRPGPPAARGFTLVAAGDVLPDGSVLERAGSDASGAGYDFRPMLAGIQPVVSRADLAICHLRSVDDTDGDPTGSAVVKTPPQV